MADNPFQGLLNPNLNRGASMWDMRMMAAANRSEAPLERNIRSPYMGRSRGGGLLSGMSGVANEPDYSSFTYDPVMRQQAIDAGVTPLEASQVRHNAVLPNSGFFGNHPRLSGALEGGLFALANAHGGNTPGESIQGAMEGIIGGQRERQGILREQFARPFEASNMLENLRDKQQKRELQAMDIEHLRALNEHYKNGDEEKATALENTRRHEEVMETIANQRADAEAPRNLGGGLYAYYNPRPYGHGTGVFPATPEQGFNPNQKGDWSIQENPEAKLGRSAAAAEHAGPWYSTTKNGKTTYNRVHEGQTVPEGAKLVQGDYAGKRDDRLADKATADREKWINEKSEIGPKSTSTWMAAGLKPGDPDNPRKLAQFYDAKVGPYIDKGAPEIGTVKDGYKYIGGDPADKNSWSK